MRVLRIVTFLTAALFVSAPAWADHEGDEGAGKDKVEHKGKGPKAAPEIDAAGLGGAAAILVGGTFLLLGSRNRRRRGVGRD